MLKSQLLCRIPRSCRFPRMPPNHHLRRRVSTTTTTRSSSNYYTHLIARYVTAASLTLVFGHVFLEYFYSFPGSYGISMIPTLQSSGDWFIISKRYRRGRGIRVGDIISFKHPAKPDEKACKRVIGMPGDFVLRDTPGQGQGMMIQVPEGHCYTSGDNLTWSKDSRMFGPLPLALISGKVLVAWSYGFNLPRRIRSGLSDSVDENDLD